MTSDASPDQRCFASRINRVNHEFVLNVISPYLCILPCFYRLKNMFPKLIGLITKQFLLKYVLYSNFALFEFFNNNFDIFPEKISIMSKPQFLFSLTNSFLFSFSLNNCLTFLDKSTLILLPDIMKLIIFQFANLIKFLLISMQIIVAMTIVIPSIVFIHLFELLNQVRVDLSLLFEDQLLSLNLLLWFLQVFCVFLLEGLETKLHFFYYYQMESWEVKGREVYGQFLEKLQFAEIQHIPDRFMEGAIALNQGCLCISHSFFQEYYPPLIKEVAGGKRNQEQLNWMCEILLVMNGQNDKAWNIKKVLLEKSKLDVMREMKFNAAVCYKNKKSSSYYEYRMRLVNELIKNLSKDAIISLYENEMNLITKILGRFVRNYFCWMYRNRLFKLLFPICGQQLIGIELSSLHKFIQINPNDYSAYSRLISIIEKTGSDINKQLVWLNELQEYCSAAYQHKQSYTHIETYRRYLTSNQHKNI